MLWTFDDIYFCKCTKQKYTWVFRLLIINIFWKLDLLTHLFLATIILMHTKQIINKIFRLNHTRYFFIFRSDHSKWLLTLNHWILFFVRHYLPLASSSIESATLLHLLFSSKSLTTILQFDIIWPCTFWISRQVSIEGFQTNLDSWFFLKCFFNCFVYLSIEGLPSSSNVT